jgi:hypothetical protein
MLKIHDLVNRRRRMRDAVLGPPEHIEGRAGLEPVRATEGVIVDGGPHLLVLATAQDGEVRVPMSEATTIWYGGTSDLTALRPGRRAIIRLGDGVGERIWIDIVRVNGVILELSKDRIEVDTGPHRGRRSLLVPGKAMQRIQIRHPQMSPGALIDVIGVQLDGEAVGMFPASPQAPGGHADPVDPARPLRGTATWFPAPRGLRGIAYPAVDPRGDAGGCGNAAATSLPYLSVGAAPYVKNDCTGRGARLSVVECGCMATRFTDRCVRCGVSPRGRIAELTPAAFVDLGGDLDKGCFNATIRLSG